MTTHTATPTAPAWRERQLPRSADDEAQPPSTWTLDVYLDGLGPLGHCVFRVDPDREGWRLSLTVWRCNADGSHRQVLDLGSDPSADVLRHRAEANASRIPVLVASHDAHVEAMRGCLITEDPRPEESAYSRCVSAVIDDVIRQHWDDDGSGESKGALGGQVVVQRALVQDWVSLAELIESGVRVADPYGEHDPLRVAVRLVGLTIQPVKSGGCRLWAVLDWEAR